MRAFAFAAVGGLIGILLAAALIFLLSFGLGSLGVQLYASESDQQRNFNLAHGFSVAVALLCAWLGFRLGRR